MNTDLRQVLGGYFIHFAPVNKTKTDKTLFLS